MKMRHFPRVHVRGVTRIDMQMCHVTNLNILLELVIIRCLSTKVDRYTLYTQQLICIQLVR